MKIFETSRLILREYTYSDFDDLAKIICDPETMKHYNKPYDTNGVQRWLDWSINNYKQHGFGLWVIELKGSGAFIGDCGLTIQNIDGELLPEIGYHINKNYWQNGYAKEAASAVRDWAFKNTEYTTLYSYMTASNIASYSTAESIGMTRVKEFLDDDILHYVYKISK